MAMDAFDLAERLQTPVFVMSDLDLGMNTWMAHPFDYPTKPFERGKLLDAETAEEASASSRRYRDVDGDGIPYRTVPGDGMPRTSRAARATTRRRSTASAPTTT